jgi:hypothetical protein
MTRLSYGQKHRLHSAQSTSAVQINDGKWIRQKKSNQQLGPQAKSTLKTNQMAMTTEQIMAKTQWGERVAQHKTELISP